MRRLTINTIAIILAILCALLLASRRTPEVSENPIQVSFAAKNEALEAWRLNMRVCESSDNPLAVNKKDLDGTPSFGLWQMKPSTFRGWVEQYEPFSTEGWDAADWQNALMDRWFQERVMDKVIADAGNIRWDRQFPACVERYGEPPTGA